MWYSENKSCKTACLPRPRQSGWIDGHTEALNAATAALFSDARCFLSPTVIPVRGQRVEVDGVGVGGVGGLSLFKKKKNPAPTSSLRPKGSRTIGRD